MERFWSKVDKSQGDNGCWEWKSHKCAHGYGQLRMNGRDVMAHRLAYELVIGPIPEGLFVCHRCDNPPCVNPSHLFLGTHMDNMRDRQEKGRNVNYRGEQNGAAKLTAFQVQEIRELYKSGYWSLKGLGITFAVSKGHIQRIVKRRVWQHI